MPGNKQQDEPYPVKQPAETRPAGPYPFRDEAALRRTTIVRFRLLPFGVRLATRPWAQTATYPAAVDTGHPSIIVIESARRP